MKNYYQTACNECEQKFSHHETVYYSEATNRLVCSYCKSRSMFVIDWQLGRVVIHEKVQ